MMTVHNFDRLLEGTLQSLPLTEKGCCMMPADEKTKKMAIAFGKEIPDEELAGDGREDFIHVTALYGFLQESPDVAEIVANVVRDVLGGKPAKATLGLVDHFECPDYDVVKVKVESKDLNRLNKELRRIFPYENGYDDAGYKAHLTIAYVKRGEADKYDGDDRFEGKELTFSTISFSNTERDRIEVKIT